MDVIGTIVVGTNVGFRVGEWLAVTVGVCVKIGRGVMVGNKAGKGVKVPVVVTVEVAVLLAITPGFRLINPCKLKTVNATTMRAKPAKYHHLDRRCRATGVEGGMFVTGVSSLCTWIDASTVSGTAEVTVAGTVAGETTSSNTEVASICSTFEIGRRISASCNSCTFWKRYSV